MFVSRPQIPLYMTLDGFTALLFVPYAAEVLAEIKRTILLCVLPPHTLVGAFYDLAITLYF